MKEITMVTFVKSTYPGSDRQYAVSGVRVAAGPSMGGDNEIRLQLAGTELELDIYVDYSTAQSIQGAIDKANSVKGPVDDAHCFDITQVAVKDLIEELSNRFNEE
jgi:hypothetical protein